MLKRFAAQRIEAEAPQLLLPAAQRKVLAPVLEAARHISSGIPGYERVEVGPQVTLPDGRVARMGLDLGSSGFAYPRVLGLLTRRDIGLSEDVLRAIIANPQARAYDVAFGWEGGGVGRYGRLEGVKPGLDYNYAQGLKLALDEAIARAGLERGDVLGASPMGVSHGDYRRALSYMNTGGMGLPNLSGRQQGVWQGQSESRGTVLIPQTIDVRHPGMMQRLGWKQPRLDLMPASLVDELIESTRRSYGVVDPPAARLGDGKKAAALAVERDDPFDLVFDERWEDNDLPAAGPGYYQMGIPDEKVVHQYARGREGYGIRRFPGPSESWGVNIDEMSGGGASPAVLREQRERSEYNNRRMEERWNRSRGSTPYLPGLEMYNYEDIPF